VIDLRCGNIAEILIRCVAGCPAYILVVLVVWWKQVRGANTLVEGHGGAEQGVDDIGVVVELLVHHEGEDAHLGGAAVVQLDGLAALDGEVGVLGLALGLDVLLDLGEAKLDGTDGEEGEGKAGGGDGVKGGKAGLGLVGAEGHAGTGGGHDVAKDGKHRDAAVLGLDGAQAVESLLVGIGQKAKRIPEAKGSLGAGGGLEAHLEAGAHGDLAHRGEGGSADEGSEDSDGAEHCCVLIGENYEQGAGSRVNLHLFFARSLVNPPSTMSPPCCSWQVKIHFIDFAFVSH
jgi:hypothetical protein